MSIGLIVDQGWQIGDSFVALGTAALCSALAKSLIGVNRPRNSQASKQRGQARPLGPISRCLAKKRAFFRDGKAYLVVPYCWPSWSLEGLFYQISCDREPVGLSNRLLQFTCISPIGGIVQNLI